MKLSIKFTTMLLLYISSNGYSQTLKMNNNSTRFRSKILDSISQQHVSYEQTKESYKKRLNQHIESPYLEDSIILSNGEVAKVQTSDNKKVLSLLSNLFSISPVDFLLEMRGIEGCIFIKPSMIEWVKKEDFPDLLKLVNSDWVTPQIKQHYISKKRVPIKPIYIKTPIGMNALNLMSSYLLGIFPATNCSYESIKDWYESGKLKSEYKYDPLILPIIDTIIPKHGRTVIQIPTKVQ